jgi:hypothetical protein
MRDAIWITASLLLLGLYAWGSDIWADRDKGKP